MTQNQINYWKHKEESRANRAGERELNRHQVEVEKETNRHNLATEEAARQSNQIASTKSMLEHESRTGNLAETKRSNLVNEAIKSEGNRIASDNAFSNRLNAYANLQNADSNSMNAQTNAFSANELLRSNLANEALQTQRNEEQHRANVASENNQKLGILTSYSNRSQTNAIGQGNLEVNRYEAATRRQQADETKRNNLMNQQLKSAELQHNINIDTKRLQHQIQTDTTGNLLRPFRIGISTQNIRR